MNHGQQRISCPKCRSNNFLGQPTCWNCGASLPPPEAMAPPASTIARYPAAPVRNAEPPNTPTSIQPPIQSPTNPYTHQPIHTPRATGLRIAIWAILILPVLLAMSWYAKTRSGGNAIEAQKDAAIKMQEELTRSLDERIKASQERPTGPGALDPDSTDAQARRELKRIYEKTGVGAPPPTDAEGNVHLQGGGTLTREQWEKTRDSLGRR